MKALQSARFKNLSQVNFACQASFQVKSRWSEFLMRNLFAMLSWLFL